jgi:hypothetical protein
MRISITLDEDVAAKVRAEVKNSGRPFKQVVNEALRQGLQHIEQPIKARPYRTHGHKMGLVPGMNLDNIQDVLETIESPYTE